MDYKDDYQALGVVRHASAEDIKKAYRKLVRKYHPDLSKAGDANQKTKDINEAYAVLGDPDKRAAYDALGREARTRQRVDPPPFGARADADAAPADFFADLFAHVGRRGHPGAHFSMRGEDVHAALVIDLLDAWRGATRTVNLRQRALEVHIPAGVLPGQQLRLAGQGEPGSGGAPAGDLFLEIRFHPDPRYRIEGANLEATLPVAPWEAALGARIEVATPVGQVQVSVPAGSQAGRKLRLKGRGIPARPPGDLFLVLDVVLPPATSERARELYRAMARDFDFNPRPGA